MCERCSAARGATGRVLNVKQARGSGAGGSAQAEGVMS